MEFPLPKIKLPVPRWLRLMSWTNWGKQRIRWGYGAVPLKLLILNFVFQRIIGLNDTAPFSVNFRSTVTGGQSIDIGARVGASFAINGGLYVSGDRGIQIGDNTFIGPNVGILTANHDLYNRDLYTSDGPVKIGNNCWIGMNAIILPNVRLGDNVTVGAGSVVTKSFPSNLVIGGVPAQVIMELSPERILEYRQKHGIEMIEDISSFFPTDQKTRE